MLGAYTDADTSAKVGFRPYYQTDAFGAAHLSGLGQNHPFKPQAWHLHGLDGTFLGTYHLNRPFDPWELYADVHETAGLHGWSGLGAAADVTAQAADELLAAGHMTQAEHDAILDGSMSFQDVMGIDPTDQGSWTDFVGDLRDWNSQLMALEAQYQQAGPQPGNAAFAQLGQQLIQQRNQYTNIAQQFIRYYTLVMGNTPSGLSGLGFAPIVYLVAGAAAFLVTAYLAYQAFKTAQAAINVKQIIAQTQQQQAGTDASLAATLARQQAAGDTVGANATIALMKQRAVTSGGTPPSSAEQWLMTNAKWIGLGAAGLLVLGPLSQGLFGRRR